MEMPMRALWKVAALQIGLLCAFERLAAACPFCGGRGASGLLENLIVVAGLWLGARAMLRASKRRRLRERPPEPESAGDAPSSSARP
jgi:hypothetical protein